jgi:hypothetical protein
MKPNSCLYRAVKKVVEHQFGIRNLKSDVFDKYNNGYGVPTGISVTVINEALKGYRVQVGVVYSNLEDPENFDHPELLINIPQFIPSPCICHANSHAEGIVGNETSDGDIAIVLRKV